MRNPTKRRRPHDVPGLSSLPPGQARAVSALIFHDTPWGRTYDEAAVAAEMSLGTLYTHLRRVRCNRPKLYAAIRKVRKAQLAVRHRNAVANARAHTRAYFRRIRRSQLYTCSLAIGDAEAPPPRITRLWGQYSLGGKRRG